MQGKSLVELQTAAGGGRGLCQQSGAAKGPNPSLFPSLKRRKPMRRPARLPQKKFSVLHPGLEQRRAIFLILFLFVPNETQNVCGLSFVNSVSIQRYHRRLEMLGWRCSDDKWNLIGWGHYVKENLFLLYQRIKRLKHIVLFIKFIPTVSAWMFYFLCLQFLNSYLFSLFLIFSLSIPYQKWVFQAL